MADTVFNSFTEGIGDGTFDLDNDTFYCALVADTYTIDATDIIWGEISANDIVGSGYTADGKALTSVTWTRSGGTTTFDAADPSWTSATIESMYAVIYKSGTANGLVNPLVCLKDFGSNQSVTSGTFTVQFNASGILTVS